MNKEDENTDIVAGFKNSSDIMLADTRVELWKRVYLDGLQGIYAEGTTSEGAQRGANEALKAFDKAFGIEEER